MLKILPRFANRSTARSALILIILLISVYGLFIWRLGSLTPGFGPAEKIAISQSTSLSNIVDNPVYLPHKLLQLGFSQISSSFMAMRLPSVLISLFFIVCYYFVCRLWFGKMLAISTSLIFASIPWVLVASRSATPDILLLGGVALIAGYIWLGVTTKKSLVLPVVTAGAALSVYIPGMVWFLFVAVVILVFNRGKPAEINRWIIALSCAVFVAGLAPLVLSAANDIDVLTTLLLIPSDLPSIVNFFKTLAWGGLGYIWSTRDSHPLIIDRLPLLSVSVAALSIFGSYIMWLRAKKELFVLLSLIMLAVVGYGFSGNLPILTLGFPTFGILMAAGLRYLYAEWRAVFPRNPIPKGLSVALVVSLVVLNVLYGMRYALAAWPNTVTTKSTYVLK